MTRFRNIFQHNMLRMLLVSFLTFIFLFVKIQKNEIPFQSDELYWIQTARILPYMLEEKLYLPYWREHMGFTNLNGAKWIYAFGLRAFGHENFEYLGIPPQTYYLWNSYDGKILPNNHAAYPILYHGRIISAIVASFSAGVMFILTFILMENISISLFATVLLISHPIFQTISLHALADSSLLLGELLMYYLTIRILNSTKKNVFLYMFLGISFGFSISVKINSAMFVPLIIATLLLDFHRRNMKLKQCVMRLTAVSVSAVICFLVLHPNLFFFPSYTLLMMIQDRFEITKKHMNYFRINMPGHVLDTVLSRGISLYHHVLTLPILIGLMTSVIPFFRRVHTREYMFRIFGILTHILFIIVSLLTYVVFNEQRYFLPVLPFICILGSLWIYIFEKS